MQARTAYIAVREDLVNILEEQNFRKLLFSGVIFPCNSLQEPRERPQLAPESSNAPQPVPQG